MNRLWVRLSLAFLLVSWLVVGAVALIIRNATESSFRHYVNRRNADVFDQDTVDALQDYYALNKTWEGAETLLPGPKEGGGSGGSGQGQGQGGQGRAGGQGAKVLIADPSGEVVAATDPTLIGTHLDDVAREYAMRLVVDGKQVGWLAQETPGQQALGETETAFLNEATQQIAVAALGVALLAVVIGVILAWQLTRPLRTLTRAAHDLAAGELGRQVEAKGTTEIIELARSFNTMSHELAAGEVMRQRMAADMAHELRTPVSVLRGHLEAMLDGVFPLDGEHLAVAYDRTIHLSRLVDDLRLLTRAEAGQLALEYIPIAPADLISQAVESFTPLAIDAGIALTHEIAPGLPRVNADVDRIQQVLGNLLTNALRHTPPDGQITLRVSETGENVQFAVSNTGEGLTIEQAANVFKPFWRAEAARERDKGGSGLGLAISKQLLTLHGGRIWVESGPALTTFAFELPAHAPARRRPGSCISSEVSPQKGTI